MLGSGKLCQTKHFSFSDLNHPLTFHISSLPGNPILLPLSGAGYKHREDNIWPACFHRWHNKHSSSRCSRVSKWLVCKSIIIWTTKIHTKTSVKGRFRDPLIRSTFFSTHTDIFAYSEKNSPILTSPHKAFCKNSPVLKKIIGRSLQFWVSDAQTSEILLYSL